MSALREALAGYLELRRNLGFTLARDAKLLDQFIAYLEERGSSTVTVTDALVWATLPPDASPGCGCGCRWCAVSLPTCAPWIQPPRSLR
jgi:hypothetical protein